MHNFINSLILSIWRETLNFIFTGFFNYLLLFRIMLAKYFLMMFKNLFWKSLKYPLMVQGLKWSHSLNWIPFKTTLQEAYEVLCFTVEPRWAWILTIIFVYFAFQYLLEGLGRRLSSLTSWIRNKYRLPIILKEQMFSWGHI